MHVQSLYMDFMLYLAVNLEEQPRQHCRLGKQLGARKTALRLHRLEWAPPKHGNLVHTSAYTPARETVPSPGSPDTPSYPAYIVS